MLSKQLQGDPQKSGLLEKITRQTFRASEIVNNLLNFSRTSGSEIGDVDVNKVIADTLALARTSVQGGESGSRDMRSRQNCSPFKEIPAGCSKYS